MQSISLRPGRESSVLRHHPWVFSGALAEPFAGHDGSTVRVMSHKGELLGSAFASKSSTLSLRLYAFGQSIEADQALFMERLRAAWERRAHLFTPDNQILRIFMSEADGLPGLIVDRYACTLVVQILSSAMESRKDLIINALKTLPSVKRIYERSDDQIRLKEHLGLKKGWLWLDDSHDEDPQVLAKEAGLIYSVNIARGHKTGHYCDQRLNRVLVGTLAPGLEVLDCFANTGGFSLNALRNGAKKVLAIDSSQEALNKLHEASVLNHLDHPERLSSVCADVGKTLRKLEAEGQSYDLVILDPPKFAPTAAHVHKALRAYKDLARMGAKLLRPGGTLVLFSCSSHISQEMFQKVCFQGLNEAGRDAWILHQLVQAEDHPVLLNLPESLYLKGLILRLCS